MMSGGNPPTPAPARVFTGWHMAAILVTFFAVVIAVNVIMARAAIGSFGGTVVDNSYVASQNYNRWIAAGRAQANQRWAAGATMRADGHVQIILSRGTADGMVASGSIVHPLGRAPERPIRFISTTGGALVSDEPLPPGRWQLRLRVTNGGESARMLVDMP